ncbi:hypothetical protein AC622_14805 [Bacillus sp. FJAT-27916]|uniref:hypothetical protein n=1 Tax=Bacillaceae TaxID=186817 RepID=UPI000670EF1D|nr:hypothetical protein [Bacillus sp. FJAT-27916]KMY45336.1 hypothetical protein AC622_14805 [Bacillus sp. FJAT-27916]
MTEYAVDFFLFALFVIGLTAFMGPLTNGIGHLLSPRQKRNSFVKQTSLSQAGFKSVGGKPK